MPDARSRATKRKRFPRNPFSRGPLWAFPKARREICPVGSQSVCIIMQRFNSPANRPIVTNIEERTMFDSVSALIGGLGIKGVHSGAGFALSYSSIQRLACPYARAALPPILASYGFEEAGCLDKKLESRQGGVDVSMTVSIPGALAGRWLDAPRERDPQFFPVYARVSRAVQRASTWRASPR